MQNFFPTTNSLCSSYRILYNIRSKLPHRLMDKPAAHGFKTHALALRRRDGAIEAQGRQDHTKTSDYPS